MRSQTRIAAGTASILNSATLQSTIILTHWLTRGERLGIRSIAGILVGMAGVVLLIGPPEIQNPSSELLARLAILGAAMSYPFAEILGKRSGRSGIEPIIATDDPLTASAVVPCPATTRFHT